MSIPRAYLRLVDDAAIFPPGSAPLPDAVAAHAGHLASDHADLVGSFVVDAERLGALGALVSSGPGGLAVSVVVLTPSGLGPVVDRASSGGLRLAGLEVRLLPGEALAPQVAATAAAAPTGVPTYVEVPRPGHPEWRDALAAVAAHGLRLKFRTGGADAAAFPTEAELAAWITAAVRARVAFKCTAGLHHAVRHTGPDTGFEHHGYLNVLLATARAVGGADGAGVEAALRERDARTVSHALAASSEERLLAARVAFTSYGSCSVLEPLEDLAALRLLT